MAMTSAALWAFAFTVAHASQTPYQAMPDVADSECHGAADMVECSSTDSLHLLQKSAELRRKESMNLPTVLTHSAVKDPDAGLSGSAVRAFDVASTSLQGRLYQLVDAVVEFAPVCGLISDHLNYMIGLAIPSVMVVLLGLATIWLSVLFPRPQASEQPHKVTRVDAHGYPVSINWHFVMWSGIAIGMANVNYVVVLPIAVEDFSGSMLEAGLWVGLYAVGALISMPLFIALGHTRTRTCLVLHGLTTMIGNMIMVYGAEVNSIPYLMTGRVVTGLAFGVYYTCNNGCLYLIPTWDRLEAIFISRCIYSIGFALGPCIAPICNYTLTYRHWVISLFADYKSAAEGVPLVLMALYGLIYTFAALFIFADVEMLDAETEGFGVGATAVDPDQGQATWEEKKTAIVMISSVSFTNFTRNFIRVLWETGTIIILAKQYCVPTGAGIIVSIVAITLVVSRNAMAKLGVACKGDNAKLMRILEWSGACSLPFMFLWGIPTCPFTLSMFLLGGIIFYNANASQSGVLLALGGETCIPGHFYLDKVALNTYMYISMLLAYMMGPVCTFILQAVYPGQNTLAAMVAAVTFLQIFCTYCSVRPKETPDSASGTIKAKT